MKKVLGHIFQEANISLEMCDLLIAEYVRMYFEGNDEIGRKVAFVTSDIKKQEAIKTAIRAISFSVPRWIPPSVLDKKMLVGNDFSREKIDQDRIIDVDNFNKEKEDEKISNRIMATNLSLGLKLASLTRIIEELSGKKEDINDYVSAVSRYKEGLDNAERRWNELDSSYGLFVNFRLGKIEQEQKQWEILYRSAVRDLADARENNEKIDQQLRPLEQNQKNISSRRAWLERGKKSLIECFDRVTQREPEVTIVRQPPPNLRPERLEGR